MQEGADRAGWTGILRQVKRYLRDVGADRDDTGEFRIEPPVITFLGMSGDNVDCVVAPGTKYFVGGEPSSLVHGLYGTSYGLKVQVIDATREDDDAGD